MIKIGYFLGEFIYKFYLYKITLWKNLTYAKGKFEANFNILVFNMYGI